MRGVDVKILANENHTFYYGRYTSPKNCDMLISFLCFSWWFLLENESSSFGILAANTCAGSLTPKVL
jgi:hypothetical protein